MSRSFHHNAAHNEIIARRIARITQRERERDLDGYLAASATLYVTREIKQTVSQARGKPRFW